MGRAAIVLLLVLLPAAGAVGQETYASWRPLLAAEIDRAAVDRPEDLYKFLHQGVLGPAHAVPDREHALAWLRREWDETRDLDVAGRPPLLLPLRPDGRLVRLDLVRLRSRVAGEESATLDAVAAAFHRTAAGWTREPTLLAELWAAARADTALWGDAFAGSALADFEADRRRAGGWPAVHHSDGYRDRCAPHYRVVDPALLPAAWRPQEESP